MAIISFNFHSSSLKQSTILYMALADTKEIGDIPLSKRKTIYLLHGLSEDGSAWIRNTNVEKYALDFGATFVMPSVGRSMYCDDVHGQNYFTFITKELPSYLHKVFGLSKDREDNFIVGASMGGYGAARAGLTYPEQYSVWGSLSGLLDMSPMLARVDAETERDFPFLIKDADKLDITPLNPVNLLNPKGQKNQRAYVACGLEDDLLACSRLFEKAANEIGSNIHFVYENGAHTWDFWDRHLKSFITFALEEQTKKSNAL